MRECWGKKQQDLMGEQPKKMEDSGAPPNLSFICNKKWVFLFVGVCGVEDIPSSAQESLLTLCT